MQQPTDRGAPRWQPVGYSQSRGIIGRCTRQGIARGAATIAATFAALLLSALSPAQTLQFAGTTWRVRGGEVGGPGPNNWSASNAWVDSNGALHLKISHVGDKWYCAEVYTPRNYGFGRYQFEVTGPVDKLDPNIVLGLFNYPTPSIGPDGTNEIDIEMSHWGMPSAPIGNFTVWPAKTGPKETSHSFTFQLTGLQSTQRFTWHRDSILFQTLDGTHDDDTGELNRWKFAPSGFDMQVPHEPEPVHLNLWLFQGKPPTDGKEVEIVITKFVYATTVRHRQK
jgi:hypothetical protein